MSVIFLCTQIALEPLSSPLPPQHDQNRTFVRRTKQIPKQKHLAATSFYSNGNNFVPHTNRSLSLSCLLSGATAKCFATFGRGGRTWEESCGGIIGSAPCAVVSLLQRYEIKTILIDCYLRRCAALNITGNYIISPPLDNAQRRRVHAACFHAFERSRLTVVSKCSGRA